MAQLNWRNSAIALKHAAQPWVYGRRGPLSLSTLKLWIPGSVRSPAIGVPSRSVYLPWTVKYVVPDGLWAPLPLAHYSTKWLVRLLREKSGHASKNRVDRLRSRVVRSARPSGSNDSGLECARSIRSMLHPASGIDETAEFASARRGPRADELTHTTGADQPHCGICGKPRLACTRPFDPQARALGRRCFTAGFACRACGDHCQLANGNELRKSHK